MSFLRYLKPVKDPTTIDPDAEQRIAAAGRFGRRCRQWLKLDKLEAWLQKQALDHPKRTMSIIAAIVVITFAFNIFKIIIITKTPPNMGSVELRSPSQATKSSKVKILEVGQDNITTIKPEKHDTEKD